MITFIQTLISNYNDYIKKGGTLKITAWIKQNSLSTKGIIVKKSVNNTDILKAIYEINKVGVNLNQLMKKMKNDSKVAYHLPEVLKGLGLITGSISELMKHVDRS